MNHSSSKTLDWIGLGMALLVLVPLTVVGLLLLMGNRSSKTIEIGSQAPPFEVQTVHGERVRLEDFKGKYLLLDFWATWCGPCLMETPHLKAVYQAFGDDDRFAMLGMSLDYDPESPRAYAAEHGLEWLQGFVPSATTPVDIEYGADLIPLILLIGPDGKVLESDLRGPAILKAVQKHLEREKTVNSEQ